MSVQEGSLVEIFPGHMAWFIAMKFILEICGPFAPCQQRTLYASAPPVECPLIVCNNNWSLKSEQGGKFSLSYFFFQLLKKFGA